MIQFWNDRFFLLFVSKQQFDNVASLDKSEKEINLLPISIKTELITKYIYADIFIYFKRYFNDESYQNKQLLYDFAYGFQPRIFQPSGQLDDELIIYDEDQEVAEMYFILNGYVGIGFSMISNGIMNRSYIVSKK